LQGEGDSERAGTLIFSNFRDNNANKAVGGRVALIPFSNSSLEIGLSGQFAGKVGDRGTAYETVGAKLYGADFNYVKDVKKLKGFIQLIGQWGIIKIDDAFYKRDSSEIKLGESDMFSFDNKSNLYYIQLAYRGSMMKKKIFKNTEYVFRYDAVDLATGAEWEMQDSRMTFGINYWLHARSAIKLAAQIGEMNNLLLLQWAIGF